jgi:WASH complex subunit 7
VKQYTKQIEEIENALEESLNEVWDSTIDPISLSVKPYEQTNLIQLIKTDNKVFNKVLLVFASVCSEIHQLKDLVRVPHLTVNLMVTKASQKFYGPLKLFGEVINSDHKEPSEGDTQVHFGRILPFLLDLSKFVNRCYAVTKNVVHQLASLHHTQQKLYSNFKMVHLQTVFDHLADLFSVLITLDEIVLSNGAFQNYLNLYKRYVSFFGF